MKKEKSDVQEAIDSLLAKGISDPNVVQIAVIVKKPLSQVAKELELLGLGEAIRM